MIEPSLELLNSAALYRSRLPTLSWCASALRELSSTKHYW